ncbi:MAG: hypothetical protein WCJ37_19460 [Syntrophus sp. (in: bacteria)]
MTERAEWPCWTPSKEEIDDAAQKLGVNTDAFSSGDYDEIERKFIKGCGWSNESWENILEEAVNLHTIEKDQQLRTR